MSSHSSSVITWTPSSVAVFNFEPAPGPATTRSVFLDTEEATFAPRPSACALASSRVIFQRAREDDGLAGHGGVGLGLGHGLDVELGDEVGHLLAIVRLGEETGDRLGRHGTDPV